MKKFSILLLCSFIFCETNIFEDVCNDFEINFNKPKISASDVSPDGQFEITVNDDTSIIIKDLVLNEEMILLPALDNGPRPCGRMGCYGEQRALFTSNGKFAITSTTFHGGSTIIWDTSTWAENHCD